MYCTLALSLALACDAWCASGAWHLLETVVQRKQQYDGNAFALKHTNEIFTMGGGGWYYVPKVSSDRAIFISIYNVMLCLDGGGRYIRMKGND